jgi:serine/threonine protein kinase
MEYLGGGEIKWKTRDQNPKPILRLDQIRRICRDVILGLEYRQSPPPVSPTLTLLTNAFAVHFQGIIHRDIKPANLVWNDDRSTVKITDFGVSHFSYAQRLAAAPRAGNQPIDQTDPVLLDDSDLAKRAGTPFYLAPEVVDSDWADTAGGNIQTKERYPRPPITKAIDIWAFGITLYSLLFGGPPFYEDDPQPHAEFRVYKKICLEDWDVPDTMGFDAVPTGGRFPKKKSEGYQVIKLLEALLEKNPMKRITLEQLKVRTTQ